jgi:hypothetical protein
MSVLSPSVHDIPRRLDVGWYVFACSVFMPIIVAEYVGPIIGMGFAILMLCSGIIWIRNFPTPRFPTAGFWLVGILLVGLASAVAADRSGVTTLNINLQRDLAITVSYILFLTVGYYFAYSRSSLRLILVALAAAGLVISIVQLVKAGMVVSSGVKDLYLFRLDAGRGSASQFAALCAGLVLLQDAAVVKYRPMILVSTAITVLSILSTLSRGLMLDLIILAVTVMGLTMNRRGTLVPDVLNFFFAIISAATVVVGVYFALRLLLPAVSHFIDEFFITRLQNSFAEVASTELETRNQIATNFRAFELERSTQQFEEQTALAQWLGQGWGATVEFGMETASTKSSFSRTSGAFFHNGYAYYLMKVGIVGLLLYIGFLCHLALRATAYKTWHSGDFPVIRRKILLAAVVSLAVNTVTGGGLGFPGDNFGLVALLGACYGPVWGTVMKGERLQPTAVPMSRTLTRRRVLRRIGDRQ